MNERVCGGVRLFLRERMYTGFRHSKETHCSLHCVLFTKTTNELVKVRSHDVMKLARRVQTFFRSGRFLVDEWEDVASSGTS